MFRLFLVLFFLFSSIDTYALYFKVSYHNSNPSYIGSTCISPDNTVTTCFYMLPDENYGKSGVKDITYPLSKGKASITRYYGEVGATGSSKLSVAFVYYVTCTDEASCRGVAEDQCKQTGDELTDFTYRGQDDFDQECGTPPDPDEGCKDDITLQCQNNGGYISHDFIDSGNGESSCSGLCDDGTIYPKPECVGTPANNYCDTVTAPSGIDFGSGSSGSSVGDSSSSSGDGATTPDDTEHDIDYEPDGTNSDSDSQFSSIQGDKLINEVVKSRNDNTQNLTATSDNTNAVIVEKSDDIQNTISNSANGIIDAVNGLGSGIDGLGDKIDGLGDELGGSYQSDFGVASFSAYDTLFIDEDTLLGLTNGFKASIGVENRLFINEVREKFNFTAGNSGGYQANNLDLGKWGSHDISLARFSEYFGGVGNVVYFLAALSALTIVLGGIKS